ncbi:MAG: Gfo/Idh/MocA family oxidoreductase [bacterium]|nr:Gfo/Idh/MocA family oxidoreductase [bacterium]
MSLRIGLIGTDGHTGTVLNGIPGLPGARLCACAKGHPEDNLDRLRNHPAFHDDTALFDDYHTMFEQVDLDLIGICRPYSLNAEAVIAAAKRNLHIICEKPIATTLQDLDAVEQAVKRNNVRLTAMLGMRLLPPFQAVKKAVAEGHIGEPILATAQKSYRFGNRPTFYKERKTYGGSIPWVAIHAIDYVRWTTGLEYTRVAALHGNLAHPGYPGCEDHGGMLFQFANGGTALVNMDYLRPDAAASHGDDRLRIAGSEGVLEILDLGTRVQLLRNDKPPRDLDLPKEIDFLSDFARELRGEGEHSIGPDEAVAVTRISLKAREAADTGQTLEL